MRVNPRRAAGHDGISGRVLKTCVNQLAPVFITIFNLCLAESVVPACFKWSTASPACLNDYRPVALTSVVMKCFERLLKDYICAVLPPSMYSLQFAYWPNRSTDNAVSQAIHSSRSHLDRECLLTFNTIVPSRLAGKLCAWILDFLTARPQVIRVGKHISRPLILNTGSPRVSSSLWMTEWWPDLR